MCVLVAEKSHIQSVLALRRNDMKRIIRVFEDDIKKIVQEYFNCKAEQVVSCYEEQEDNGEVNPIFYIEVEENGPVKR